MSPFPNLVAAEVRRASELHAPLANHDESLSVLQEEVHEVRLEVYKKRSERSDDDLLKELVQVAAMARRWSECCQLEAVIRSKFDTATPLVVLSLRRLQGPANSDHESLTRLERVMHRVAGMVYEGGPTLGRHAAEVALALTAVAATCQRWAEDRRLVPFDPKHPAEAQAVRAEPVRETGAATEGPTEGPTEPSAP